jgi:hypothetical protein
MTHTRPSATAEATSWRAVGAGVLGCHTGGAGAVVVVAGADGAGAGAVVVVVTAGAAGVAGVERPLHETPRTRSRPTSRRVVTGQRYGLWH